MKMDGTEYCNMHNTTSGITAVRAATTEITVNLDEYAKFTSYTTLPTISGSKAL